MILRQPTRCLLLFALAAASAGAQTVDPAIPPSVAPKSGRRHVQRTPPPPAGPNLDVILLDPAHGRQDPGARLGPNLLEKDLNLAFAQRLRALLASRGFNVALTRENDPVIQAPTPNPDPSQPPIAASQPAPLTADARAELANRLHPLACLLLHASSSGRGIHLYTSALTPVGNNPQVSEAFKPIQLWDTAQAAFLPQSRQLAADLSQAVRNLGLPVVSGAASVSPIDSMACASVIVELAPAAPNGGATSQPNDPGYQSRLANSILEALLLWRSQETTRTAAQTATRQAAQPKAVEPSASPVQKPKPKPRPKPVTPNVQPAPATPADPTGAAL